MTTQPVNAADPEALKEKGKKDRLRERQEKEDLRKVLETREGRNLLHRIIASCGVSEQPGSLGTEPVQYFLGRRAVGLKLQSEIRRAYPNALLLMLKEDIDAEIEANG